MKFALVGIYILSVFHIHFRGKVRLPFMRQLFDHSSFMAPINWFMHTFSRVPSKPYLPLDQFKELEPLAANWQVIRAEAEALRSLQKIKAAEQNDDAGFNSFFKNGWKRFYLKWYDASHPSAEQLCPQTYALLKNIPSVKAAMFAELPPGGKLNPHRDPFAGSLRYHLGLATPNDDRCFIDVDGERHSWRDGQGVMFDETYIHWAVNGSDSVRIILFCDVERPLNNPVARWFNHFISHTLIRAAAAPNSDTDRTGGINRLFAYVQQVRLFGKRIKARSRFAYYGLQWLIFGGLFVWWIFG